MEVENYYLFDMIGCGSYGQVYKAKQKGTNRIIAVKLIKKVSSLKIIYFFLKRFNVLDIF